MKPLTPQEVRLGNLTSHGVVVGIFNNSFDVESQTGEWYSLHDCEISPVPLTPEILEGFGAIVRDGFCFLHGFYLRHIPSKEVFEVSLLMAKGTWKQFEFKHAHTLQNFIHAISGVELVYKQNKTE